MEVVYGDIAETLMIDALYFMKLRTGWEFPEPIEELLIKLAKERGFDISNGIMCVDNCYVNGEWGEIAELDFDEDDEEYEENLKEFFQDCIWHDDTYWVKSLWFY